VITADGTVDVNSAGLLTLDSGAAINIEPAACSAILLDGTISIDAGVVTGATSITSTAFVGALTGDASGTAATVTSGTQASITTVANVVTVGALNAGSITSGFGTIDTGSSAITTTGLITGGTFSTGNSGTAKFPDGNGSHYFTLAAHATTTASVDYTWPAADGSACTVLTTDSCGVLSWAAAGVGDHSVAVTATGAQSLANESGTLIAFGTEVFDTDAYHDNSTNNSRLTVPAGQAGKYIVTGTVRFTANATGDRIVAILMYDDSASAAANKGQLAGALAQTSSNHHAITVTGILDLDEDDYVTLEALQSSGGSLNTVHAEGAPTLQMIRIA
jgi:hypothetical protein